MWVLTFYTIHTTHFNNIPPSAVNVKTAVCKGEALESKIHLQVFKDCLMSAMWIG
jgi:hypothetical protein